MYIRMLTAFILLIVCYMDLYFLHYLLFGLVGYNLGLNVKFEVLKSKINILIL